MPSPSPAPAQPQPRASPSTIWASGIVVRSCCGGSVAKARIQSPEVGALLVHGNRVSQPAGQAIWAMGLGQMSVHDNQLSAGNLGTVDIISAVLRMLDSDFDNLGDVASIALTHFVGLSVTLLNLGLPIDAAAARGSLSRMGSVAPGSYGVATTPSYQDATAAEVKVAKPVTSRSTTTR